MKTNVQVIAKAIIAKERMESIRRYFGPVMRALDVPKDDYPSYMKDLEVMAKTSGFDAALGWLKTLHADIKGAKWT